MNNSIGNRTDSETCGLPGIKNFYGARQKRQWHHLEKTVDENVKRHKVEKLPKEYKGSINGPSTYWQTFFRQQDAFQFARGKASDLHVFAFESKTLESDTGQRKYLAVTYPVFWHYYKQLDITVKHHYEVIAEGAVCKLYFDLEFMKEYNSESDGSHMVETFITVICYWLKKKFNVECSKKDVLDLDASTEKKFSRHLIFILPGFAFKDNIHAGNFVHFVASDITDIISEDHNPQTSGSSVLEEVTLADLQSLMVKNKHGDTVLFCDLGVYTKNRNFRLYQSCKMGKTNPLVLAKENKHSADSEEQIFFDSMIANIQYRENLKILSFEGNRMTGKKTKNTDGHGPGSLTPVEAPVDGYSMSPYPEVDEFITAQIQKNRCNGCIRHWLYFPQGETIVYEIAKYRWCENIGRAHKSNNIMLIADLKKAVYYQKCHDPECKMKNFKSQDYSLPKEVLPAAFFEDDEFDDVDEMDDQEFLQAALEVEKNCLTDQG